MNIDALRCVLGAAPRPRRKRRPLFERCQRAGLGPFAAAAVLALRSRGSVSLRLARAGVPVRALGSVLEGLLREGVLTHRPGGRWEVSPCR